MNNDIVCCIHAFPCIYMHVHIMRAYKKHYVASMDVFTRARTNYVLYHECIDVYIEYRKDLKPSGP